MVKKKKAVTLTSLLQEMVDNCPRCKGKGEVRIWEAVDPVTKIATGWFKKKWNEAAGHNEYVMRSCPYCGEARKFLRQPALFELDNPEAPAMNEEEAHYQELQRRHMG